MGYPCSSLHCINESRATDPTSGSGSLLINIGKSAARYMGSGNRIKYYAQELKENTYNLTRMNLVMRGILPDNIVTRNGDTLEEDWPYFDDNDPVGTYDPLYVDAVVSNPPYSQAWNPADKETDPRYSRYGIAPRGKADYAFLLHDLYHLKPDGIMTIVLPHGVLFRGGEEGTIRKNLIEQNNIDAIIGLPANIFFGTGIPTIVMVLRQKRVHTDVLIIDASKGFEKSGKNNKLRACDIKKIVDVVTARATIDKFSRLVTKDEIRANDYNLNIPRYVDSSEKAESWDIYSSMFGGIPESELADLQQYWEAFPHLKEALFTPLNSGYYTLKAENLPETVQNHPDIAAFISGYTAAFDHFSDFLNDKLIRNMQTINIAQAETVLSDHIFSRMETIPLVDRYSAYQLLDQIWGTVSIDLEVIQTEGFAATKQVDPHMVLKKKGTKEEEIQEGWVGHVLPFDLVEAALLPRERESLNAMENRLAEITGEKESLMDELSEENKEQPFVADDSFVPAEIKKALRTNEAVPETLSILQKADELFTEEKDLKKQIKEAQAELHLKTKHVIETLTDEQAIDLLRQKWIVPLVSGILDLPRTVIDDFVAKLETLCTKYNTTFAEIEQEISDTERTLTGLLDQLQGSEFDEKGLAELKALLGGE
ncbi:MAG: N-6 DNA methylase, partial [Clostridiales bacterium]|nr:N-6 DNA methylase [Clostridiales bacterium]